MTKYSSSWKISIALAAVAVLAAFVVLPGGGTDPASANVASVTPDGSLVQDGSTINVNIAGTAGAAATLTVAVTGSSTLDNTDDDCTDDDGAMGCGTPMGSGTDTVTWDDVDDAYTARVELTFDCNDPEQITVTATDDGTSDSATYYCVPNIGDPQVEVEKQSDDNEDYDFDWSASGGDCVVSADDGTLEFGDSGTFDLEDNDNATFWCESSVNLFVDEDDDFDFVGIDDCDEGDEGVDGISGSTIEFDISDIDPGDTVFCTWVNDEDLTPVPTVTTGTATSVTIVLTASQVNCGGSMLVQVIPRSANGGPVSAGTQVSLTSSLGGSFQPSGSVTSAFPIALVNFLYTAPANASGTTTLTARAGNVQTSAAVQIVCQVSPTTPATPVTPVGPLLPPSAGDGGLVGGSSGAGYLPAALAVAAAALVLGLTAVTRRFAAVTADIPGVSLPGSAPDTTRGPGGFALLVSFVMLVVALLARRWR
jgi:hypothetical protein